MEPTHPWFNLTQHLSSHFSRFIPAFNRRYSFSDMQCAHQQRGVRGDFVNLRDLPAQAAVYTHRCRVACMYTKKLSEFVREPEDDF